MMALVRLALRRPYTIAVLSLLILLLGFLSVKRMIVDFFPKIDIPVVFVGWNYPGLSAEEMERRVVIISERAYSTTVNGIERIESTCIPGTGLVKVFFHPGMRHRRRDRPDQRHQRHHSANPAAGHHAARHHPVQPGHRSDRAHDLLQRDAAGGAHVRLRAQFRAGQAVHDSRPAGAGALRRKLRQISVDLNPRLMAAKSVSPNDVVQTLLTSNLLIPTGTARIGDDRLQRSDELQPADGGRVQPHAAESGEQRAGPAGRRGQGGRRLRGAEQHRARGRQARHLSDDPQARRRFQPGGCRGHPRPVG